MKMRSSNILSLLAVLFIVQSGVGCKTNANDKTSKSASIAKCPGIEELLEKPEKSVEYWSKRIQSHQNCGSYYFMRGKKVYDLNYMISADEAFIRNRQRSILDFSQAIRLNTNDVIVYMYRGEALHDIDELDKALQDFSFAIHLEPDNARVYSYRGETYSSKGDYDNAIKDFTQAIRISPQSGELYHSRATAYLQNDDFKEAISDYSQALRLGFNLDTVMKFNTEQSAYTNRAYSFYRIGDYDNSIKDYSQAIKMRPKEWQSYRNRGNACLKKGDKEQANKDFEKAKELGWKE